MVIDLSHVFNALEDRKVVLDRDFHIVAVTNGFIKSSRYKREEILNKSFLTLFLQGFEDPESIINILKKIVHDKSSHNLKRVKWKDFDKSTYWNLHLYPLLDIHNEITNIIYEIYDVTDEVNKELLLNTVEKELLKQTTLSDILNRQSDGFFIMDREEVFTYVNKFMADFGQSMGTGNLVGRPVKEVFVSDDTHKFLERYHRIMETKIADHFIESLDDRFLSVDAYPTQDDGVAVFFRDVTKKLQIENDIKEHRSKLQLITDHIPAFVAYFDSQGRYQFVNKKYQDWFELEADQIIGKKRSDFATPQSAEMAQEYESRALLGETIKYQNILEKNDQKVFVDVSYVPDMDKGTKEIKGVFVIGYEVTDQVEALSLRDEFMSIASHELKTPITSMSLLGQKFVRQKVNSELIPSAAVLQYAQSVDKNIKRLNRLIDDMLDITRIKSGKLSLLPEHFDLTSLVQEIVDRYLMQYSDIKLNITDHIEGYWDRLRLDQVISNLIGNSIKYGNKSPITVTVSAHEGRALIQVKDHGPGIARENQRRVFERYERDVKDSKGVSGLGLGLYICKEIVERHNGQISLQSELGSGATFSVELPLSVEEAPQKK